jgi:beta-glucanase (GH16 family)
MKPLLPITGLLFAFATHAVSQEPGLPPPMQAPVTNQMTFDEEFDRLDLTKYQTYYWWAVGGGGRWLQDELEVYVDPLYQGTAPQPLRLNPFSIHNGVLQIQASVPAPTVAPYLQGQKYISGILTTYNSFSQLYGYFEIRAQIPSGKGYWPTFWLLPKVDIPTPPEIDVLEARGDDLTHLLLTAHYNLLNEPKKASFVIPVPDMSVAFHRYGMLWTAEYIAWYFDGIRVAYTPTPADLNSPMYLLLNLAVGGGWIAPPDVTTPFPGNFLVDYIRVCAAN